MKRRDFIRMGSFITVSVAALGVSGCHNGSSSRGTPPPASDDGWKFPQSVASGDPHPDSIILWTRVTRSTLPATDTSSVSVTVKLKLTKADNSLNLGQTGIALAGTLLGDITVPAYGDFDGAIRHKLTGLDEDSVYYYQFVAGSVRSKIGRFKTARSSTAPNAADPVKFAFMSCQEWSHNHWGAYSQLLADDGTGATPSLDFIVHLGDYIYETDSTVAEEARHGAITLPTGAALPSGGEYASELADYRYLYKLYRSDTRIQAVHERFPMIAVWDDHEFSDDGWQASETYTNANASQPERRRNANQAWFEFMPVDVTFSEADTSFNNISIYRDLKFGSVMHLVMTDERLYRVDHVIAENTLSGGEELGSINSRYLAPEATFKFLEDLKSSSQPGTPLNPVSMLGETQRDWWKSTMQGSTASWKIWGNEVSLLRMGLNGRGAVTTLLSLLTVQTIADSTSPLAGKIGASSAAVAAGILGISDSAVAANGALQIESTIGSDTANTSLRSSAIATAGTSYGSTDIATVATDAYIAATDAAASSAPADAANAGAAAGAVITVAAIAATPAHSLNAFLQKFLMNADQWDGYHLERQHLMQFLETEAIQNVVAITGDIHAFFAGQVHSTFAGEVTGISVASGTPVETAAAPASLPAAGVMVDLVTAGISSTSWYNYIKAAAANLDPKLLNLVSLTLTPAQTFLPFDTSLPVLDFTMGKPFDKNNPDDLAALAAMARDAIRRDAAANGVLEADLPFGLTPEAYGGLISGNAQIQGLCQALASLGTATNPWLKHIDTDAQGYAVVTVSAGSLSCEFKRLNTLFNTGGSGYAPGTAPGAIDTRPLLGAASTTVVVTSGSTVLSFG